MNPILERAVYGLTYGIVEFLPVAASAHLYALGRYFDHPKIVPLVMAPLGMGAFLAVSIFLLFNKSYTLAVIDEFSTTSKPKIDFLYFLAASLIPVGVVFGLFMKPVLDRVYTHLEIGVITLVFTLSFFFFITGVKKTTLTFNFKSGLMLGLFQCFQIIPGAGRQSLVFSYLWWKGVSDKKAVIVSVMTLFPLLLGNAIFSTLKGLPLMSYSEYFIGVGVCTFSGVVGLSLLKHFFSEKLMLCLGVYRLVLVVFIFFFLK